MIPGISASPFSGRPVNPRHLFRARQDGFWLDPSDHSTLWIDEARTQNATLPGDVVWWIDDKSPNQNHFGAVSSAARGRLYRWPASAVLEGYPRNRLTNTEALNQWDATRVNVTFSEEFQDWEVETTETDNVQGLAHSPLILAGDWTAKVDVRKINADGHSVRIQLRGGLSRGTIYLNTHLNPYTGMITNASPATVVDLGTHWRVLIPPTVVADTSRFSLRLSNEAVGLKMGFRFPQVEVDTGTLGNYQRVGSGIWDVTEEGQADCWGIGFDGVSTQYLSSRGIPLFVDGKMRAIVGQTKLGLDSTSGQILGNGSGFGLENTVMLLAHGASDSYVARYRSSAIGLAGTGLSYPSPNSAILDQLVESLAGTNSLRVNDTPAITSTPVAAGSISSGVFRIGALGGGSNAYNGIIWGCVMVAEEPDPVVWEQSARQWLSNNNMGSILDV